MNWKEWNKFFKLFHRHGPTYNGGEATPGKSTISGLTKEHVVSTWGLEKQMALL